LIGGAFGLIAVALTEILRRRTERKIRSSARRTIGHGAPLSMRQSVSAAVHGRHGVMQ